MPPSPPPLEGQAFATFFVTLAKLLELFGISVPGCAVEMSPSVFANWCGTRLPSLLWADGLSYFV